MRKMIQIVAAAGLALTMFTAPAMAQTGPDYVFNVPVRVENTPSLNGLTGAVQCSVAGFDAAGRQTGYYYVSQLFNIGPAGFNETLRLELTLPAGVRRADLTTWLCQMNFQTVRNGSGVVVPMPLGPDANIAYTSVTGQTVASSRYFSNGEFARP